MGRPVPVSLHVGAHKTATTHLQKTLLSNAPLLARNGVRFAGPAVLRQSDQSLAKLFGLGRAPTSAPLNSQEQLRRLLGEGGRRLVLSEENLLGEVVECVTRGPLYAQGDLRVERLVEALAPSPIRLFLAVRDPASWLASVYRHALFNGRYCDFETFVEGRVPKDIKWSNLIERLRRIPGIGTVYVWKQEEYPSIAVQVFRRMLGWRLGPQIKQIPHDVNVGLSSAAVAHLLEKGMTGDPRSAALSAQMIHPVSSSDTQFNPWPAKVLEESRVSYDADIARVAKMDGVEALQHTRR